MLIKVVPPLILYVMTIQAYKKDSSRAALDLASAWNTPCIRVFICDSLLDQQRWKAFTLVKDLMQLGRERKQFLSVLAVTVKQFITVSQRDTRFTTCFKPLGIIVPDESTKQEFIELSKRHSTEVRKSRWVVILKEEQNEEEFFNEMDISFNMQLISGKWSGNILQLREVYRVVPFQPLFIKDFGTWNARSGLNIPLTSIHVWRPNLDGITLRIGALLKINEVAKEGQKSVVRNDGFFPRVWNELETAMNFTSVSYSSIDNSTGVNNNGEWSGLVGMLLRNEIDVIVSELNMYGERTEVLDFTHPLLRTRYQIYFKLNGFNLSWTAMFEPFDALLWLVLAGWILVGTFALIVTIKLSINFEEEIDMSVNSYSTYFFMMQSMCQQGYYKVPRAFALRIVFLLAYILSAIIVPSYSASLISSLTAKVPSRPFDSLRGLLQYGNYKLLIEKNTAEYDYFSKSEDKLYNKILKALVSTIDEPGVNGNMTSGMQMLCDSSQRYAFFGVESTFDVRAERVYSSSCQIIKFSQPLSSVYQSLGMAKGSPYTGLVDYQIRKMFSSGIINRLQRSVWPLKKAKHDASFKQVQPSEVFQIFVFLLLAIILSVVLVIVEIITFRHKKRLKEQERKRFSQQ